MQLLEKDIHDKQDTLISLRRQLQDIKTINLDLHTKWQVHMLRTYIIIAAKNHVLILRKKQLIFKKIFLKLV